MKYSLTFTFLLLTFIFFLSGCESLSKARRTGYIEKHPYLTDSQKKLILKGRLWTGMEPAEVKASLGDPAVINKDLLGETEIWNYHYKASFTSRKAYLYYKALRLEFREGRLVNWRED